jgi:hypothetical protein
MCTCLCVCVCVCVCARVCVCVCVCVFVRACVRVFLHRILCEYFCIEYYGKKHDYNRRQDFV